MREINSARENTNGRKETWQKEKERMRKYD